MSDLVANNTALLETLSKANQAFNHRYVGNSPQRQPVHTVYGGAHLFQADTAVRLGVRAQAALARHGGGAFEFAQAIGLCDPLPPKEQWLEFAESFARDANAVQQRHPSAHLALTVYERVQQKLAREAVEDFRIDFEDGFGVRPDAEEDATAKQAALEVAKGLAAGTLPPFIGIRIKTLSDEHKIRALRTLDIFLQNLLEATAGRLPPNFVVTLPKITIAQQASTLAEILDQLERRHRLQTGTLRMEMMIEVTQALLGPDGRSPLGAFLDACNGRCVGAHLGTYDFTASCDITAAHQVMDHPMCDLAKGLMKLAYAGTGIFLSDGATNVLPVGPHKGESLGTQELDENTRVVHAAWRLSYKHIRHSLVGGYFQGWDLHPAQLPVRYAAVYGFFLEGFAAAAARLKNFIDKAAQATLVGDVFDDAATGQGLLNYFLRAYNCGAIALSDLQASGLTQNEIHMRSFAKILAGRQALNSRDTSNSQRG